MYINLYKIINIIMINKHFYKKMNDGEYDFSTIELKNEHMETDLEEKPKDIHKLYGKLYNKYYNKMDPFSFIHIGSIMLKINRRNNGLVFHYFYIDRKNYALNWFSRNKKMKDSRIKVFNIFSIKKNTKNVNKKLENYGLIFNEDIYKLSLEIRYKQQYLNKNEVLFLIARNKLEQELWYEGLHSLKTKNEYQNDKKYKNTSEIIKKYKNDENYKYIYLFDCLVRQHIEHIFLEPEFEIYRQKILKRINNLNKYSKHISSWILPLLKNLQTLINNGLLIFDENRGNLNLNNIRQLSLLLYQLRIEYYTIKDIYKALKQNSKEKRINHIEHQVYMII